jgi:cytochrome c
MKYLLTALCLLLPLSIQADQMTAIKSGCFGCHQPDKRLVGPSFKEIAARFTSADLDTLVETVKNGRTHTDLTWGKAPMPPNPAPEADVRKVIEWMLSH